MIMHNAREKARSNSGSPFSKFSKAFTLLLSNSSCQSTNDWGTVGNTTATGIAMFTFRTTMLILLASMEELMVSALYSKTKRHCSRSFGPCQCALLSKTLTMPPSIQVV